MSCALALAAAGIAFASSTSFAASTAEPPAASETGPPRIEARSTDLLAVGLVRGDRMSIHLSRQIDNAPVRDAAVTVVLRGVSHPTTAETDGSYTLQTKDLGLPGSAAVEFLVTQAAGSESLKGTLQIASAAARPDDKNNARQLWWWVLNFAVCIGFLMLLSRRRKRAES